MSFFINVEKEYLKFSSAHFTLFDDGREPLHGHNFCVKIEVETDELCDGFVVNFVPLKKSLRQVCDRLDECVLLPTSKRVQVSDAGDCFDIKINDGSRYTFPKSEVIVLPLDNVTCESLAYYISTELLQNRDEWDSDHRVSSMRIWVQETPGQSGGYAMNLKDAK